MAWITLKSYAHQKKHTKDHLLYNSIYKKWAFQVAQLYRNLSADAGDEGLIPGSRRFPGEGNGNPFWYSCLGNPMDREVWWAVVHRVARVGHN